MIDFEEKGTEGWISSSLFSWDTSAVGALSGRFSLMHVYDNPDPGHDQISICIDSLNVEAGNAEWQFKIRYGYDPSPVNNWAVFIVSDGDATEMHPGGYASGYAIGVNYHGSDDLLKLWKIGNGEGIPLITTGCNWQEEIGNDMAVISVSRSVKGEWKIFVGRQGILNQMIEAGSGMDEGTVEMQHFGLYYKYSSRQDQKIWIDDILINGTFFRDTTPPELINIEIFDSRTLCLFFSEKIDTVSLKNIKNFFVMPEPGYPSAIIVIQQDQLKLVFETDIPDGKSCKLQISDLKDQKGNVLPAGEYEFMYYIPKKNDVIFSEIMADPLPSIGLPEYEYIELYNRSDYNINMKGWTVECGKTIRQFPDILLQSGAFLLLVDEDAEEIFSNYGNCVPLFTSRTSLPNSGAMIKLWDQNRNLICWLNYSNEWFSNDYYRSGGWSIERIDPDRICGGGENWSGSIDLSGGTPGSMNSVNGLNPDTIRPRISFVEIPEDSILEIVFTEPMDSSTQYLPNNFYIDHDIGYPEKIVLQEPAYQSVLLVLNDPLRPGIVYRISVSDELKDCAGNRLNVPEPVKTGKPELPLKGDILISEIMFDPLPGKTEFLELYNHSEKVIDLGYLIVAKRDEQTGIISSWTPVYKGSRLFFPGEFLLLTSDIFSMVSGYTRTGGTLIEVPDMPVCNDSRGTVVIMDMWLNIIDEFGYHREMHFSLLNGTEGISLERISYDRPASDLDNWHSASENTGFSTPGYSNSQSVSNINIHSGIKIEPEIFTPDNDGKDDFTSIWYSFGYKGCVMSIWIFDTTGRLIRKLTDNQLVGTSGCITWDGLDDHGQRARMGMYLVFIRFFDLEGRVREIKKTCILSVRRK